MHVKMVLEFVMEQTTFVSLLVDMMDVVDLVLVLRHSKRRIHFFQSTKWCPKLTW